MAIGKFGNFNEQVIDALVTALEDENEEVRYQAAWALTELDNLNKNKVISLLSRLNENDFQSHFEKVWILGMLGYFDKGIIFNLLNALKEQNPGTRYKAVLALIKLNQPDKNVIDALVGTLKDESQLIKYRMFEGGQVITSTAIQCLGKSLRNISSDLLLKELEHPKSGYRLAAAHALAEKDTIFTDATTMTRINNLKDTEERPWVRLAAWKAYELIEEKRVQFEKEQKEKIEAKSFIKQADSLFQVGQYFYAGNRYSDAFEKLSVRSNQDSLYAGNIKFKQAHCLVLQKGIPQTINSLKTAFNYNSDLKDSLEAIFQRGDKDWAIIKDNWYVNEVLLKKK